MTKRLASQNYEVISDLDKLISKDEIYKFGRTYHLMQSLKLRKDLKIYLR